ncbi:BspA family leucine-rich repeat surface protein [Campylobacter devanensis]|uniref:BspA family leucine-rich repeat surface protein n=1 Tax=Campylobacter devanensis TaxID=3161138 RepID=UPI000A33B24C|nr:BspA family leucine-rich repeat surface protein [Campylobacter sp. P0107]
MYKTKIENIIKELSSGLFEREECLKLVLLSMFAGKSIFLYGPPGTAKSMIARRASLAFKITDNSQDESKESNNGFFAYLMNRFSTPEEIFGPIDIAELKKNNLTRKTDGYLPTAHFAFLDEIWKSSPAILNTLLTIINERIYRDGNKDIKVPLKGVVCASNEFPPDNQGLEALYDRMILRYFVKPLDEKENFFNLLQSPSSKSPNCKERFTYDELEQILKDKEKIKISPDALELIHNIKVTIESLATNTEQALKILDLKSLPENFKAPYISDRRWKQCAELLQTAALLSDRDRVERYDLALLAHLLWSSEEDKEIISRILSNIFSENSRFDDEIKALKSDSSKLKDLIEKNLYLKNGKPKKLESSEKAKYLEFSKEMEHRANALYSNIKAEFDKTKVNIKNPFLSPSDIELVLSSFINPMKDANNQALLSAELKDMVENPKENESIRKRYLSKLKHHPKNKSELKKLVNTFKNKLDEIDVSAVSDFSALFENSERKDFSGIEYWDVSNATDMNRMFAGAKNFNIDISDWDVSNVTDMSFMFMNTSTFNRPLESWDVSKVKNMNSMFCGALSFNRPLNKWNVSNVANMSSMFMGAAQFNQPLNSWNVSNVKDMESMFCKAKVFNQPLDRWKVSNKTNVKSMFSYSAMNNHRPRWCNY